jgi:hypothetical protein
VVLISAIPRPPTESIATQFEIVSLIFIRGFFREIGQLDLDKLRVQSLMTLPPLMGDIGGGLILFLLVTVFKHVGRRSDLPDAGECSPDMSRLIFWKKIVALAASGLHRFMVDAYQVVFLGARASLDPNPFFYSDFFTAMIFVDVLVLILSLAVSEQYEFVSGMQPL